MALLAQPAAATQGQAILAGTANTETATTVLEGSGVAGSTFTYTFQASTGGNNISTSATALLGTAVFATDVAIEGDGNQTSAIGLNAHATNGFGVLATATSGFGIWAGASAPGGVAVVADGAAARSHLNFVPAPAAGPPSGAHAVGDVWLDNAGVLWVCLKAGTPGVFAPLQMGGANLGHFVKVSNQQYLLPASDGATWKDIDATNLKATITPAFNAQAVLSVSADLWTATAGLNQDIGIYVEGGAYGAAGSGTIVAWKESGGFAGTFSPNAAFVETSQPMVAGTAYTVSARWKANKPAGTGLIAAGAGPLPSNSAGGGVAGQFSPTRLAVSLIPDGPSPAVLRSAIPAFRNNPALAPAKPSPIKSGARRSK
jgi:hypothetical protein